jgi:hypothetical protein
MSAAENDVVDPDLPELIESDHAETRMTFGRGKWTWYVVAIWVGALIGLGIYAANLLVPSLGSWGAP